MESVTERAAIGIAGLLAIATVILVVRFYARLRLKETALWRLDTEQRLYETQALNPNSRSAAIELSNLYEWRMYRSAGQQRLQQAVKAFEWREHAYKHTVDPLKRLGDLHILARMAFDAGCDAQAAEYATELLMSTDRQPAYGSASAVHYGHLVLGRLALRTGHVTTATTHLLASAKIGGGPALSSAGPNMMLAKELLDSGVTDPVLEYLALCGKFWQMDFGKLDRWKHQIIQGKVPSFRDQLFR